jgi:hypothetical protein
LSAPNHPAHSMAFEFFTDDDCTAPAAAECTNRRPARACRAWAAYGEPSAPHVARYARPACR